MKDDIRFNLQKRQSLKYVVENSSSIEKLIVDIECIIQERFYNQNNLILNDDEIDELMEWEAAKAAYKKLSVHVEAMPVL